MVRVGPQRQRFRSSLLEPQLDRAPLGPNLAEPERVGSRASDDDEVHTERQELGPKSKALAAEPFDAISPHRTAEFAGDDHAKARQPRRAGLSRHEQREMGRAHPATQPLRTSKLGVPPQPPALVKLERHYFL
jgi:hypothetical protein